MVCATYTILTLPFGVPPIYIYYRVARRKQRNRNRRPDSSVPMWQRSALPCYGRAADAEVLPGFSALEKSFPVGIWKTLRPKLGNTAIKWSKMSAWNPS